MGRIDTETKKYFSDNTRFADAFNYFVYGGKQVIAPTDLTPLDTTEIVIPYENETKEPVQKFRDILKRWQVKTDGSVVYALLGEEIQSKVHYAMPVKAGLYDFINYADQVENTRKRHRKQRTTLSRFFLITASTLLHRAKCIKRIFVSSGPMLARCWSSSRIKRIRLN